jgi:hypothetical protein
MNIQNIFSARIVSLVVFILVVLFLDTVFDVKMGLESFVEGGMGMNMGMGMATTTPPATTKTTTPSVTTKPTSTTSALPPPPLNNNP